MMHQDQLQQFLTLSEQLHFGRASQLCNVSPSTLSRNINALEARLKAKLFLRNNRSVALTAEGEKFRQYASAALAQWAQIENDLKPSDHGLRGEVSLYCSVTASYSILYDLLNQLRVDHPGIELKLHTGDADHAIDRISGGQEQIAISARPEQIPHGLHFKSIQATELCFIAAKSLNQADIENYSNQQWQQAPMILAERGLARAHLEAWFKARAIRPRIYAQVAGYEAIVSMVSLGLGLGVVPQIVLDHSPLSNRINRLDVQPALPPFDLGLITQRFSLQNPLVAAFFDLA